MRHRKEYISILEETHGAFDLSAFTKFIAMEMSAGGGGINSCWYSLLRLRGGCMPKLRSMGSREYGVKS